MNLLEIVLQKMPGILIGKTGHCQNKANEYEDSQWVLFLREILGVIFSGLGFAPKKVLKQWLQVTSFLLQYSVHFVRSLTAMSEELSDRTLADYREAFKAFDKDGDGLITAPELVCIMKSQVRY